jgi:hypothetical protein
VGLLMIGPSTNGQAEPLHSGLPNDDWQILLQPWSARREAAVTAVGAHLVVAEGIDRAGRGGNACAVAADGRRADFEVHAGSLRCYAGL